MRKRKTCKEQCVREEKCVLSREGRAEEKGVRGKSAGVKKMAQVKLACRPASTRLNTDDVVVGCPRFPTTTVMVEDGGGFRCKERCEHVLQVIKW